MLTFDVWQKIFKCEKMCNFYIHAESNISFKTFQSLNRNENKDDNT